MNDALRLWSNTRLIVLTAVSAAVYAAALIPFKAIQIVPGLAEIRPAAALPLVCSICFGPAGAWGAAFGNLIGDAFGMLGPGSAAGFVGNFLYGYIPYRVWRTLSATEPHPLTAGGWLRLMAGFLLAAGACAFTIAWGVDLLGLVPFPVLAKVILINNLAMAVLAPFLVVTLYPMIKSYGLLYTDLMEPEPRRKRSWAGLALVMAGVIGGLAAGEAAGLGWAGWGPWGGVELTGLSAAALAVGCWLL